MYAPSKQGEQPSVEVSKEFMMSPNKLYLEASLDKVTLCLYSLWVLLSMGPYCSGENKFEQFLCRSYVRDYPFVKLDVSC